jgi:hypothetical protein
MTQLEKLLAALDASKLALRRDECGDYRINGKSGHIYPDGRGFLLCVSTGESLRRWTNVKARLGGFCRLTQDGDDEGALHLDHLPSPTEATIIREALGIKPKRTMAAEALARLERARSLQARPLAA